MRLIALAVIGLMAVVTWSCKTPEAVPTAGSETKDWLVTAGDWIIKGKLNYPPALDYKKIKLKVDIRFFKSALTAVGEETTGALTVKATIEPTGQGTADVTFDFTPVSERYTLPSFTMEGARHHVGFAYHGQGDQDVGRAYEYANPPSSVATNDRFIEQLAAIRKELSNLTIIETPELTMPMSGSFATADGSQTVKMTDLKDSYVPGGDAIAGQSGHAVSFDSDDGLRTCKQYGYGQREVSGGVYKAKSMKILCTHGPFGNQKMRAQFWVEGKQKSAPGHSQRQCKNFKGTPAQIQTAVKANSFKETFKLDRGFWAGDCSNGI